MDFLLDGVAFGFACTFGILLGATVWHFLFVKPPELLVGAVNAIYDAFVHLGENLVWLARRVAGKAGR